jgi:hypothetical protein
MKLPFIGAIGAGLLCVALAATAQATSSGSNQSPQSSPSQPSATPPSGQSSATTPPTQSSTATAPNPSPSPPPTQSTQQPVPPPATSAAPKNEISGVVKKIDRSKRSVQISSWAGGEHELKLSPNATITRGGSALSLDQLKEGDQVLASFDPSSKQATRIQIEATHTGKKPRSGIRGSTTERTGK